MTAEATLTPTTKAGGKALGIIEQGVNPRWQGLAAYGNSVSRYAASIVVAIEREAAAGAAMTSNPANTAAEPRTPPGHKFELFLMEAEVYWPDRDTRVSAAVLSKFLHEALAEAAQDRPAEPGLREALEQMIEHDEEQRDNCGDWGTNPCLIRERARRALAASPPERSGLDVERLAKAVLDNVAFDEDSGHPTDLCRYCMDQQRTHASDCVIHIAARLSSGGEDTP